MATFGCVAQKAASAAQAGFVFCKPMGESSGDKNARNKMKKENPPN
jgi:hypothetical protein